MKTVSGKKFCKLIEKRGWKLKRVKGSHHIYVKEGEIFRISIPVHGNKALKMGLQKHLMKIAKIDDEDL